MAGARAAVQSSDAVKRGLAAIAIRAEAFAPWAASASASWAPRDQPISTAPSGICAAMREAHDASGFSSEWFERQGLDAPLPGQAGAQSGKDGGGEAPAGE